MPQATALIARVYLLAVEGARQQSSAVADVRWYSEAGEQDDHRHCVTETFCSDGRWIPWRNDISCDIPGSVFQRDTADYSFGRTVGRCFVGAGLERLVADLDA